jgi:ADP-ribose pyrophosphatase YjhB (NUDIX family)
MVRNPPDSGLTTYFATDPTELRLSVSAVVRREAGGGEILLMRRADNEHWGLPGGYVEPGESVVSAAAREVQEETGYEVDVGHLVGVYSEPKRQVIEYPGGERVQAVNLCFEALAGVVGEPTTPEETLEIGFHGWDRLPEPFVPIHRIRIEDAFDGERAGPGVAVR